MLKIERQLETWLDYLIMVMKDPFKDENIGKFTLLFSPFPKQIETSRSNNDRHLMVFFFF